MFEQNDETSVQFAQNQLSFYSNPILFLKYTYDPAYWSVDFPPPKGSVVLGISRNPPPQAFGALYFANTPCKYLDFFTNQI